MSKTAKPDSSTVLGHWFSGSIMRNRYWKRCFGRIMVTYEQRSKHNAMGRFGGGWQWEVGIQAGPSEAIINLLVASVRIRRLPLCADCGTIVEHPRYKWRDGHMVEVCKNADKCGRNTKHE